MFNLQGSEIIFILLIALVVLGPDKLPDAVKRFTQTYNELRKMGSGLQSELKSVIDEPTKQVRDTAAMLEGAVDPDLLGGDGLPGDETARTGSKQTEPPTKADTTGGPDPDSEPESAPAGKSTTGDSSTVEAGESDVEVPAKPINSIAAANSSAGLAARAAAKERAKQAATEREASKANGDPDPVAEPDSAPESAEPAEPANSASERSSDGLAPA